MYEVRVIGPNDQIQVFYSHSPLSYQQENEFLAQFPNGFWLDISRIPIDPDEHVRDQDDECDF